MLQAEGEQKPEVGVCLECSRTSREPGVFLKQGEQWRSAEDVVSGVGLPQPLQGHYIVFCKGSKDWRIMT
jgi:hypothetical protein